MSLTKSSSIFIAGHRGMVGSAIMRQLQHLGYENIITADRKTLNLLDLGSTQDFFKKHNPEFVILCAARVGGIQANIANPVEFLTENLTIQNNVINTAYQNGVQKLVFLGSSCIYPRECPQPMKEEYLLSGKLEPTNEGYSIAKIAGLKLCEYYHKQYQFNAISVMPSNLYGPNDSFDLAHSHVLSALVKRFSDAVQNNTPELTLWGTGSARRELMHVDDCAKAVVHLMENYNGVDFVNIGTGEDISIKELALKIASKTGFKGEITWDTTKPDGMMRKCVDVSRLSELGFKSSISLDQGIDQMIDIYKSNYLYNENIK